MYASSKSGYAPCCVSEKFNDAGPDYFWSGEVMSSIRNELLQGEFPKSCEFCKKKTESGLKSEADHWNRQYELLGRPPLSLKAPLVLDYRPSNQCNLKCRMCGSAASSSIESEVAENPELSKWYGNPKRDVVDTEIMSSYIASIELKKIKLLGGEPSIDPGVWDFIDKVSKIEPQPVLMITTNATSFNPTFIELLSRFVAIKILFSVDAIGDEYDYIRTNARWKNTQRNVVKFFENFTGSAKLGFNVVVTPYNIFSLNRLIEWFVELVNKGYKFEVNFIDSDDAETGLSAVLPQHIDAALSSLDYGNLKTIDCLDLISLLEAAEYSDEAHRTFKKYTAALDRIRKTNLIDLDDRFKSYIDEPSI